MLLNDISIWTSRPTKKFWTQSQVKISKYTFRKTHYQFKKKTTLNRTSRLKDVTPYEETENIVFFMRVYDKKCAWVIPIMPNGGDRHVSWRDRTTSRLRRRVVYSRMRSRATSFSTSRAKETRWATSSSTGVTHENSARDPDPGQ